MLIFFIIYVHCVRELFCFSWEIWLTIAIEKTFTVVILCGLNVMYSKQKKIQVRWRSPLYWREWRIQNLNVNILAIVDCLYRLQKFLARKLCNAYWYFTMCLLVSLWNNSNLLFCVCGSLNRTKGLHWPYVLMWKCFTSFLSS